MSTSARSNSNKGRGAPPRASTSTRAKHPTPSHPLLHHAAPVHHVQVNHPNTHNHPDSHPLLHSTHPLPPPPHKKLYDETYGWKFWAIVAVLFVVIAVGVTFIILWQVSAGPFASSSKPAVPVLGGGNPGTTSTGPAVTVLAATSAVAPVDTSYQAYLNNGGLGNACNMQTEPYNQGCGVVASSNNPNSPSASYSQCLAAATLPQAGVTMGDLGNQGYDLNAYRFSTQQTSRSQIETYCSELCCATTGCYNSAVSNVAVQYPNYNWYGCTDLGPTPVGGIVYDTCCILRSSSATGYTNPYDHNYTSVFYTTLTYKCNQGAGAATNGQYFVGTPINSMALAPDSTGKPIPDQGYMNQCMGLCANNGPNCGVSIINGLGNSVTYPGTSTHSMGNTANLPWACFVVNSSSSLVTSNNNFAYFTIPVLPSATGATQCSA